MKKLITASKSIKRIYIVLYDQQEFLGYDTNTPVKAFKTKKMAEVYANSRNFEFQSICMLDDEDYENYVLGNTNSDFVISVSDFRDAHGFVREEIIRLERSKLDYSMWTILSDMNPFKVYPIEYITDTKNF
jgi:hypothetical protein